MAQYVEPMDVDCMDSEFDNKENTYHHSNVLPCTEKGYEELDVSELNMKLRYSMPPASSPMSKSYTAYVDSNNLDNMDSKNGNNENANLTRSLSTTMSKNDSLIKSLKSLPLQSLPSEQFVDGNGNPSVRTQLDSMITNNANVTITVSAANDIDENLSLASSSSSALHTPATTPTKEIRNDGGSPIMRGLKSVLNMFRPSQSPIPPGEGDTSKQQALSPADLSISENVTYQAIASTPIATHKTKEGNTSRRSSPLKDSIVFNDDLEKELNWKDETTILFSGEKIPIHKLFYQQPKCIPSNNNNKTNKELTKDVQSIDLEDNNIDTTVEYMDISLNNSIAKDRTITEIKTEKNDISIAGESDSEFVDCETTFTKCESELVDNKLNEEDNTNQTLPAINPGKPSVIADILPANELGFEISSMSFNEGDGKKDVTSDYSNYSRETTEILSELDKIEASVSPKAQCTMVVNVNETEMVATELLQNVESLDQNLKSEKEIKEDNIQAESLENFNATKEVFKQEILQSEEYTIDDTIVTRNDDNCDPLIASEPPITIDDRNVITQGLQQTLPAHDVSDFNIASVDQQITDSKIDENKVELSQFTDDAKSDTNILANYSPELLVKIPAVTSTDNNSNLANNTITINFENPSELSPHVDPDQTKSEMLPSPSNINIILRQNGKEDNAIENIVIVPGNPEKEKPADVPFPDEEDIDKEVIIVNELPKTLIGTNTIFEATLSTQVQPNITYDNSVDNSFDEKLNNDTVMSETAHTQDMIQLPDTASTAPVLNLTEVIQENVIENNPENKNVNNDIDLPDAAIIKQERESNSESGPEETKNMSHDIIEVIENNLSQDNNINTIVTTCSLELPEVVSTCNTTIVLDALNVTDTKNNSEKNDIEPMDITMNETLNKAHDLPDVINTTITMIEDNIGNTVKKSTVNALPHEIAVDIESHTNLEENEVTRNNTEPVLLYVAAAQLNEESVKHENNELISKISIDKESVPNFYLESKQTDSVNNDNINDVQPFEIVVDNQNLNGAQVETVDEEIIVSENNSPYVSLMTGLDTASEKVERNVEEAENHLNTTINIPSSPPIRSRGYNFNFDEMDDPFATKNKLMSPPLDGHKESTEIITAQKSKEPLKRIVANRRKSQPAERKNASVMKKKFNASFDAYVESKMSIKMDEELQENINSETSDAIIKEETTTINSSVSSTTLIEENKNIEDLSAKSEDIVQEIENQPESSEENKISIESITSVSNDTKIASSLEQSTYYSAGTSSTDSFKTKNVFNLPEIDDINFNPFATKSKVRQSPQRDMESENPFATRTKILNSPEHSMIESPQENLCTEVNVDSADKMETELMEKETSVNISCTTASSKAMDCNLTTREVNTEDEDTEEGPFLETDDLMDNILDFNNGNDDMMQFNKLPTQEADDNLEGGELFIDAEAFEYLLNKNETNVVADSGKESLFLKFDPLFAKRMSSNDVFSALSKVQPKQSTPTKPARPSLKHETSPIAGPSTLNITYEGDNITSHESNDDLNVTVSKPMMVVTPAVNPAVTPRNKSITPTRSNRRSITFTSPAIAVIDRLLAISSNNSFVGQDTTISQSNREQNEADLALTQLRELLAEKEISVYNLRSESKELKDRLANMESQVKILEADGQCRLKKINELNERLAEKTRINKCMAAVVEEYERTIASLIAETEQDKKRNAEERIRLINERDEQTAHLASMEVSFSDLHSKYEKSKQVIFACKANEETYKKSIKDFEENLNKMQTNYELLKQHATSKLNHANQELDKMKKSHEADVVKLNALIKRKDLQITSLEETLSQKTKANEVLTTICDELINKVG